MTFIKKFISIKKIKKQLLFVYLFVIFFPILVVGFYSIKNARKQMLSNYKQQLISDNLRIKSTMFDITTMVYNFSENIISDNAYSALFSSDFQNQNLSDYTNLNTFIDSYIKNTTSIKSIAIYTQNTSVPNSAYIHSSTNFDALDWYDTSFDQSWNYWKNVLESDSFNNEAPVLTLIRRIPVTNQKYPTYLVIKISTNYIKNRLQNNNYFILCSVNNNTPFLNPDKTWNHKAFPFLQDQKTNSYISYTGSLNINNKQVLSNISTFLPFKTNDYFYILVGNEKAYNDVNNITKTYAYILCIAVFLPTILVFCFSNYFSSRLITLKNVMHQVQLGNYNITDQLKGDDELNDIFLDLYATVMRICKTEQQYYKAKITEQKLINNQQKMEFQLLSSQINPHFLYNTLESIRMQALSTGNRNVAHSISLLGDSMHYVLENSGTQYITLAQEIDYINVYLKIQKLRFGDRIEYDVITNDNLKMQNHRILPFILQPIIENSISHGLEKRASGGYISIYLNQTKDQKLEIKISDNGQGMDKEQLALLHEKMYRTNTSCDSNFGGIGLRNIAQRIKLLYQSPYGITIKSKLGIGTDVTILLPINSIQI